MKHFVPWLFAAMCLCAPSFAGQPELDAVKGVWVTARWNETLLAARSVLKANQSRGQNESGTRAVIIEGAAGGVMECRSTNFWETLQHQFSSVRRGSAGEYRMLAGEDDAQPGTAGEFYVRPLSPDRAQIALGAKDRNTYVRVMRTADAAARGARDYEPAVNAYVNKVLLSGKYSDDKGRTYEFRDDGRAWWAGMSMRYSVNLLSNQALCDFFILENSSGRQLRYAFEIKGKELILHEAYNDVSDMDAVKAKPAIVLTLRKL